MDLKDSTIIGFEPEGVNYQNATAYIRAVNDLNKQFDSGRINCIHLSNYGRTETDEHPVEVEITEYTTLYGNPVPNRCSFTTSHYIGYYGNSDVSLRILPRFGDLFSYFLGYAANVFLPIGESGLSSAGGNSYWLLAVLWKSMLNSALTTGQIPKTYIDEHKNLKTYRGRLDIHQNIRNNLVNQSKFYCTYRKLSMDNTINRAVRHAFRVLRDKGLSGILADMSAFDQRLESFGVKDIVSDPKDLDNIRYTRMNAVYQPVVNLCKTIINNDASSFEGREKKNVSYMIDVAELWELYLLRLLQRNLPPDYFVYSPNSVLGDYLLEGEMRIVRPDILIEKDGKVVLIIDAKYKRYSQIGKTGTYMINVQRDDLYQMNTYLYHYGRGRRVAGVFTSPVEESDSELHRYANNPEHRIGVVNLNIDSCGNNVEKIHAAEDSYVKRIINILSNLS
jgi:5-methylcytosine-specific restriction endonuclease McrBC regulatory subunit McrC